MVMKADKKSSLVQIAQATLDEVNQATKVAFTVNGDALSDANPMPVKVESQAIQVNVSLDKTEDSVTAWQGGGAWAVSAASLPLPAGAATETTLLDIKANTASLNYVNRVRLVYSSTNVTTATWVQLLPTVGATSVKEIEIFDSSGETLELGVGALGSEVSKSYVFPGGNGRIPLQITANTRLAVKAVSATANSGEIVINLYG